MGHRRSRSQTSPPVDWVVLELLEELGSTDLQINRIEAAEECLNEKKSGKLVIGKGQRRIAVLELNLVLLLRETLNHLLINQLDRSSSPYFAAD